MHKLSDYISKADLSVVQAMEKIDQGAKGILYVTGDNDELIACITDGDIRRWIIKTGDLGAPVSRFMMREPKYIFENDLQNVAEVLSKYSIRSVPVVDARMHIIDIIFSGEDVSFSSSQEGDLKDVPVVIMAGGKGTRLYPYTRILPKPLIPIGDVPIMERIIDGFTSYQVGDFYITVNYMKSMIKSYFEDISPEYRLHYVEEDKPLGTGGSLGLIKTRFDKPFFVTNCDIIVQANLADIYKQHSEEKNAITIVTSLKKVVVPYGVLDVSSGGRVDSIREKPSDSYFINTGMYVINPEMIDLIPGDTFYHMTQLVEDAISKGYKVGIYPVTEDAFLDMGEIEELQKMEDRLGDEKIAEVIM